MISETEIVRLSTVLHGRDPGERLAAFKEIEPVIGALSSFEEKDELSKKLGFVSHEAFSRKFENTKATFRMRRLRQKARDQGLSPATLLIHAADRSTLRRMADELRRRRDRKKQRAIGTAK